MSTRPISFGQCRQAANVILLYRRFNVGDCRGPSRIGTICRRQLAVAANGPSLLRVNSDKSGYAGYCPVPASAILQPYFLTRISSFSFVAQIVGGGRWQDSRVACKYGNGTVAIGAAASAATTSFARSTNITNTNKALHFGAKIFNSQQRHSNLPHRRETKRPTATRSNNPTRSLHLTPAIPVAATFLSIFPNSFNTSSYSTTSNILSRNFSLFSSQSNKHHNHQSVTMTKPNINTKVESNDQSSDNSKIVNNDRNHLSRPASEDRKVLRIIVEGNIGSGKTTFLKIFSKNCASLINKPLIVPEPIDLWRSVGGVNIFQLLADDPKRWSFAFQSYVQLTMCRIHEMMPEEGSVKVMERSLFSARYCFVENLLNRGLLQPCEYFVLDEWFKNCCDSATVDLIIYLRTDPDVVFERIHQRGRPEESGLTLDYLRSLHDLHEDWLMKKKFPLPAPVITIDANIPLEQIMSVYEEKTGGILREHVVLLA